MGTFSQITQPQQPSDGGQQPQFGQPNQYANTLGPKQPFGFQSDIGTPVMNPGQFDQVQPTWAQLPGMNNQPMPMKQNFDQPSSYPVNAGPQRGWDNATIQPQQSTGKGGKGQSWQPFSPSTSFNSAPTNNPQNVVPQGPMDDATKGRMMAQTFVSGMGKGAGGQLAPNQFAKAMGDTIRVGVKNNSGSQY